MAQQDISTYKSGKNVLFADNTSRAISEADSRTAFENTADSFLNKTDEFRDPVKGLTATHAANAYTVTAANYAAYTTNIPLVIKPSATNTGADPTINVNSLGAKIWYKKDGSSFSTSDIQSGEYYMVVYDGTNFVTLAGDIGSGSLTSPSGSDTQIQYNDSGSFGASNGFKFRDSDHSIFLYANSSAASDFLFARYFQVALMDSNGTSTKAALNQNSLEMTYGGTVTAMTLHGRIETDTGTNPAITLQASRHFALGTIATRPLLNLYNYTTKVFEVAADGSWDFNGNQLSNFTIATNVPSSASDTGVSGEVAYDSSYFYICTATNTWKRVAISTW